MTHELTIIVADLLGRDCQYRGGAENIVRQLGGMSAGLFARLLDESTTVTAIDTKGNTVAGVGLLSIDVNNKACTLSALAVDPAKQGQGIGTELLHNIEVVASGRGCTVIRLIPDTETSTTEPHAKVLDFFTSHGYGIVETGFGTELAKSLEG